MSRTHVWMEGRSACSAIACVSVTNSYISTLLNIDKSPTHVWMQESLACSATSCVNVTIPYTSRTHTRHHAEGLLVTIDDVMTWVMEILTHESCQCHELIHITNSHMSSRRRAACEDRRHHDMSHGNTDSRFHVSVSNSYTSRTHTNQHADGPLVTIDDVMTWVMEMLLTSHVSVTNSYISWTHACQDAERPLVMIDGVRTWVMQIPWTYGMYTSRTQSYQHTEGPLVMIDGVRTWVMQILRTHESC